MRYVIIGTSGCGKSTLARALAKAQQAPHVELDALHWAADWTPRRKSEFIEGVRAATQAERWVADGNYGVVRDVLWSRATHIVWLNFGRGVVIARVIGRTLRRSLLGEPLWSGNRETLRRAFFSRESIVLWSLTTFHKNRRKYAELRGDAAYAHLHWIELRTPREARRFLESMSHPPAAAGQAT
ncbi:AAA family ATPase [Caldimonas sp. KR1-144]|uniref:AAA family ATPase n=1 Tax=Caldimonas sp. KR1-144 TaxID=3400911 RepID=UPI003C103ACD